MTVAAANAEFVVDLVAKSHARAKPVLLEDLIVVKASPPCQVEPGGQVPARLEVGAALVSQTILAQTEGVDITDFREWIVNAERRCRIVEDAERLEASSGLNLAKDRRCGREIVLQRGFALMIAFAIVDRSVGNR